jgi:hypothetical protein
MYIEWDWQRTAMSSNEITQAKDKAILCPRFTQSYIDGDQVILLSLVIGIVKAGIRS